MNDTCLHCGMELADNEIRELIAPDHPTAPGWLVFRCGSRYDPGGFCNWQSPGCMRREIRQKRDRITELEAIMFDVAEKLNPCRTCKEPPSRRGRSVTNWANCPSRELIAAISPLYAAL